MSKVITFVVPCYNSAAYIKRCVDSLLPGGEDVEILIIDDGSTDDTARIADQYAEEHPENVRAIHKENGGHGSAINIGLAEATGKYFKVVDSDDWLEEEAYRQVLRHLKEAIAREEFEDLLICNYSYNHLLQGSKKTVCYENVLPQQSLFSWQEIGHFHPSQYMILHSMIYRTMLLKRIGITLPEHTFFVDNLLAYIPLPKVRRIYYLNVDLYQYFIGREDQSVNEEMLKKRIDQQIKVTKLIIGAQDLEMLRKQEPKLADYMLRNVSVMMTISIIHLMLIGDAASEEKRKDLWKFVMKKDLRLYQRLHCATLCGLTCLPGKIGAKIVLGGYRLSKQIFQFQ